jgi:hypothetical protein
MSLLSLARTAIFFGIVVTPTVAAGQQGTQTPAPAPQALDQTVVERTYAASGLAAWRRVETRSESEGREVVVETLEAPDAEGRWAPVQEIVTEAIRTGPGTVQTRRDVFAFDANGRSRLLEITESLWETFEGGDTSTVHDTWAPDLDGRLALKSRLIERTLSPDPDVRQADTTRLVRDVNGRLREVARTEYTARETGTGVVLHESTSLGRDVNGRWQSIETRRVEVREIDMSERVEEETIYRKDINGRLAVAARNVVHRSSADEQDDVVIETYAPYADGFRRSDSRLALWQRVHVIETATADGGSESVEEVEGRSRVAPGDPLRVLRRTVTRTRQVSPDEDRWVAERQVFERDVNGRLRLVVSDTEERTGG